MPIVRPLVVVTNPFKARPAAPVGPPPPVSNVLAGVMSSTSPLYSADKGNDYRPLTSGFINANGRLLITWAGGFNETYSTVGLWELRSGYRSIVVPDSSGVDAPSPASDPSRGRDEHESERLSVPDWLPELAEAVAGLRLTGKSIEAVPIHTRLEVRRRLSQLMGEDSYSHFARWFFADVGSRSVTPSSDMSVQQYVQRCLDEDRLDTLYLAFRLDPANGRLQAQLARRLLQEDPLENPRHKGEADYFSRQALALAPEDMVALSIRSDVLVAQGRLDEALQILETRELHLPCDPDFWHHKGLVLEKAGRFEEAAEAYVRAVELSGSMHDWSKLKRARYLLDHSELLRAQDRTKEAESAAETALTLHRDASTQDWPMWGGEDLGRNMYSPGTGLPDTFDPGKLNPDTQDVDLSAARNVKWVARLGSQSYGNVTVAHGRVFIGTNNDAPRDRRHSGDRGILLCLDENTGNFLWQLVIPKLASGKVNDWEGLGLLSSPAVEGNRVYVASSRCEVLCLTTDSLAKRNVGPFKEEGQYVVGPGKPAIEPTRRDADIVWRYDMMDELGVFPHNGTFTSPLILGDLIYLKTCNGVDWTHSNVPSPFAPSLIAIDKKTGELAGVDDAGIGPRILHAEWGSASAGKVNGTNLVFFGGGDGICYALNADPVIENGQRLLKKVWWADCNPQEYRFKLNGEIAETIKYPAAEGPSEIIATPVFWKNRIYVATGQDPEHGEGVGNLVCIDATKTGNVTKTGILWRNKGLHRSISTVGITPEGLLFVADFSGFIHCIDAETGKSFWQHDMKAHVWGSTLVADGKVYVGDEDGDFVVLAASKEKKVLSKLIRDGDGPNLGAPIYSTPVVANGVLYVASHTHLYAICDASKLPNYRSAKTGLPIKLSDSKNGR